MNYLRVLHRLQDNLPSQFIHKFQLRSGISAAQSLASPCSLIHFYEFCSSQATRPDCKPVPAPYYLEWVCTSRSMLAISVLQSCRWLRVHRHNSVNRRCSLSPNSTPAATSTLYISTQTCRSNSNSRFTLPALLAPRRMTQPPQPRIAPVRVCTNRSGPTLETPFISIAQGALMQCPTSQIAARGVSSVPSVSNKWLS